MSRYDTYDFYIEKNWLHARSRQSLKVAAMEGLSDERFEVLPSQLEAIVSQRRDMFVDHIEEYYQRALTKNAGNQIAIRRPAIWLAQLGTVAESEGRWNRVFTETALDHSRVVRGVDGIRTTYQDYWHAVENGADGIFRPAAQRISGRAIGGAWLLLELDESKLDDSIR